MRITDRNDWFELWTEDKQSMMDCMIRNMHSDLDAGYDYWGISMIQQRAEIEKFKIDWDMDMEMFKGMDEKTVNRWCFYDMKKRGVIG